MPVISFDNIGPKEIIKNGFNGFLVEKNNEEQLKEIMDKMIYDNDMRLRLSQNSYRNSNIYSISSICNKWDKILKGEIK